MRCAAALLILLVGCGSADSGTRHAGPDARVGQWRIHHWPQANNGMRLYLRETVELHDALLSRFLLGDSVPPTALHFYQTPQEWHAARNAVASIYGRVASIRNVGGQPINPLVFFHPFDLSIHCYAGTKLEAEGLGHAMLHAAIGEDLFHLDPRWQRFLGEDAALSIVIRMRR